MPDSQGSHHAPLFDIPTSSNTVTVRVIDTTAELTLDVGNILQPRVKGHNQLLCPSYSFLIEHESGRKILFDLGVQKNWEQLPRSTVDYIKQFGWEVKVEKDVPEILEENGYRRVQIETVVWR